MPVICATCRTENRDNAMFCRGCAGKLPAFAPTGPAVLQATTSLLREPAPDPAPAAAFDATPGNSPRPSKLGRARWWTEASVVLATTLVAAVVGILFTSHGEPGSATSGARLASAPAAPPSAQPTPTTPPASPAALTGAPSLSPEASLSPGEAVVPSGPRVESKAAVAPTASARTAADLPASPGPVESLPEPRSPPSKPAPAQRIATRADTGPADPRIGCENLNFIFASRCEANHCDQPAYARHFRCDAVREQRQRDEARRNPTLGY